MKRITTLVFIVIMLYPCLARAISVVVQAEDFSNSCNIEPENIRSDNSILKGLDCAGEWTQYKLEVTAFGTYSFTVRCWGDSNVEYKFRLTTAPIEGEEPQSIEFRYTGKGSCGS
jgi:hypothetical protein